VPLSAKYNLDLVVMACAGFLKRKLDDDGREDCEPSVLKYKASVVWWESFDEYGKKGRWPGMLLALPYAALVDDPLLTDMCISCIERVTTVAMTADLLGSGSNRVHTSDAFEAFHSGAFLDTLPLEVRERLMSSWGRTLYAACLKYR